MSSSSPLWGSNYTVLKNRNSLNRQIARMLAKPGMKRIRELVLTLNGVAPGSAASATRAQIDHSLTELGGVRGVSATSVVSRNTTAADVVNTTADPLGYSNRIATPVDGASLF